MNTITKILKVIVKIVWGIVKVFLKVISVILLFMFSVVFGTPKSNKWQYDAEYYGYE